jgi:CO/xanthine dehydrogenase Mo-binding subunit
MSGGVDVSTIVGQPVARNDAIEKVTGRLKFPGDLNMAGQLYAKMLWSEHPHARIQIDTAAAEAAAGVVAVFTAKDVPHNEFGLIFKDQPVFSFDVVRSVGDPLAMVVAETEESAAVARDLIRVTYQDLPTVTDPREAMKPGAPLIHEEKGTNVLKSYRIRKGDVQKAFEAADIIVEDDYFTPPTEQAFMQPEAGIGYVDDEGRVVVHSAGQWAHDDRHQIAHALGLAEEEVRVIYTPAGGAFGGREDISVQLVLCLAAWKLKRPVKMVWNREESIRGHHKRHAFYMHHKLGATKDGKITAMTVELVADCGAYASSSTAVLANAVLLCTGPYEVPNINVDGYVVYTNNLRTGAMRGFGAPQAIFAVELQMSRLAEKLGMDPAVLRMKNVLVEGSKLATNTVVPAGVGIRETLVEVSEAAGWSDRGPQRSPASAPQKRMGIGLACGWKNVGYSFGFAEQATCIVELHGEQSIERAVIKIGAAEVGQGVNTILAQIAAQALRIPYHAVEIHELDTSEVPGAGSSSASRQSFMSGNAVKGACERALEAWNQGARPAIVTYQYRPPSTTPYDPETGECYPNFSYGYASQVAEVEVDMETGEVALTRVVAAHDTGKTINPQTTEGQVDGGVVMAQGWALIEDFIQQDGYIKTRRFSEYMIPTSMDAPQDIVSRLVEVADPLGPYGARGIGEMTMMLLAPAILDAIHDATGIWFNKIPVRAEDVLLALKAQR